MVTLSRLGVSTAISLDGLKRDHPSWSWSASKIGFGWSYTGRKNGETVSVVRVSPGEDIPSEWRVYGDGRGVLYDTWDGSDGESNSD